jgi:hypothetical protein
MPDLPVGPDDLADLAVIERLAQAEVDGDRRDFQLGPFTVYLLVCAIQLAVRHPDLGDELRERYVDAGRRLQACFAGPTYDVLEKGWHARYDRGPDGRDT